MQRKICFLLLIASFTPVLYGQKNFSLASPDGKLKVAVALRNNIEYAVLYAGDTLVAYSPMAMYIADAPA